MQRQVLLRNIVIRSTNDNQVRIEALFSGSCKAARLEELCEIFADSDADVEFALCFSETDDCAAVEGLLELYPGAACDSKIHRLINSRESADNVVGQSLREEGD